ncbi:phosphopantetheine-binding protein [Flammeovirga sp. SJP92]|uniref:phosphopantetheine-binding protein n=1 Tax=Flammeovirga sp. SJP92 TaxID=1775430 RepID=UPI000787817E|nr:phosphopantetheine-binding protein [Flammeovirga sp. SJP92]KXX71692.1 acyl carrier protein [Flammeovirga sp. SJP92]
MNLEELKEQLKVQIIEQLNLEEVEVEDIDNEEPLFGDGLGLDSIDALELVLLLEKEYGIKLENPKAGKEVFGSIDTMANFIAAQLAVKE